MKMIGNQTAIEKSAKVMALLSTLLVATPYSLGAERANEDNNPYDHSTFRENLPQEAPANVERWIDYMSQWARNTVSYRRSTPEQRFPHQVEFQATPDDTNHQTRLVASFYFQDGQNRVNIPENNEHVKLIPHRESAEIQKYADPRKRLFLGKIHSVNAVTRKFERPCFVLGVSGLEFEYSYVAQTLQAGEEYQATLTQPGAGNLRGYYQVSAPTQILPSNYVYSDGSRLFLTRHASEDWISLRDGLVNERTAVNYVLHMPHSLTLDSFNFINRSAEAVNFPVSGLYILSGNKLKLPEEAQENTFRYQLKPINIQQNQEAFPAITLNFSNDRSLGEFLLDASNSAPLHPWIRSIQFPAGMMPTHNADIFRSLLALKRKLPNLNAIRIGERNLIEESINLLALIRNCPPQSLQGRNALEEIFTEQRNQNTLGAFLGGFNFSSQSVPNQQSTLDSVILFSTFVSNLTLRNCGRLVDNHLPHLFQGQLTHVNFHGCSALTNTVVDLLESRNPGLNILDLSNTSISYIGTKEVPKVFTRLQNLILNDCPSLRGVHVNASALTTLTLNEDRCLEQVSVLGTNLKQVACRNTRIKDEHLYGIFDQTQQFIDLDLTGCSQLSPTGQKIFLSINNAKETTLVFREANLGESAARVLATSKTSTSLNLENNRIGRLGILAFCSNSILSTLKLDNNNIGNVGAQAIAELLTQNQTLTWLSLNHNRIEDEGALAIANILKQNLTLRILDLSNNPISEQSKTNLRNNKSAALQEPSEFWKTV